MIVSKKRFEFLSVAVQAILVIALLAVIGFVWAITISPIEFIRFERDRHRIRDLRIFSAVLENLEVNYLSDKTPEDSREKFVYVSLPDRDPGCSFWHLPPLGEGHSYRCASAGNYQRIDGSGWLPVDFSRYSGWRLTELPVDPINAGNFYYQYIPGSYSIAARMESVMMLGQLSQEVADFSLVVNFEKFSSGAKLLESLALINNETLAMGRIANYIASRPPEEQNKIISNIKAIISFAASRQPEPESAVNSFLIDIGIFPEIIIRPVRPVIKPAAVPPESPSPTASPAVPAPVLPEVRNLAKHILSGQKAKNAEDSIRQCLKAGGFWARIQNSARRAVCCQSR